MQTRSSSKLDHAALITAALLWGASFYFGKVALREVTAHHVVLWRFVLALAVLVPLAAYRTHGSRVLRRNPVGRSGAAALPMAVAGSVPGRGTPAAPRYRSLPLRRDWPLFLLNASLMVPVQFVLQFEGLARTTASSAALIVGAFAPLLAVAAIIVDREQPGAAGWLAILCSTIGLVLVVGAPGEGRTLTGDLMVLTSLLAAVGMVLCTRRLVQRYDALAVTVISIGLGTLLLLPWTWIVHGPPPVDLAFDVWAALIGLGVGCTAAAFSLWNWGLRHVPASHAGVYVNLEPLIGAALGILFLGDILTLELLSGGSLILASAVIVSWPRPAPTVP